MNFDRILTFHNEPGTLRYSFHPCWYLKSKKEQYFNKRNLYIFHICIFKFYVYLPRNIAAKWCESPHSLWYFLPLHQILYTKVVDVPGWVGGILCIFYPSWSLLRVSKSCPWFTFKTFIIQINVFIFIVDDFNVTIMQLSIAFLIYVNWQNNVYEKSDSP